MRSVLFIPTPTSAWAGGQPLSAPPPRQPARRARRQGAAEPRREARGLPAGPRGLPLAGCPPGWWAPRTPLTPEGSQQGADTETLLFLPPWRRGETVCCCVLQTHTFKVSQLCRNIYFYSLRDNFKVVNFALFEAIWPLAGFGWHQPEHSLRFAHEATKDPGSALLPVFSPAEGQKKTIIWGCVHAKWKWPIKFVMQRFHHQYQLYSRPKLF